MQSFFSCFSCGQKSSSVVTPQPIVISSNKIQNASDVYQNNNISLIQSMSDQKSKTATTITFRTTQTAMSKIQDDQQYIYKKVQQIKKKDLAQRKALQNQFIRQNMTKSSVVYLIEKEWSQQYTRFLKDPRIKTIRNINNKNLIDNKGKLKDYVKQKDDYFIINQRIWKFVEQMYGGGPGIARDTYFPVFTIGLRKVEIVPCGIQNPLNLCYMISIIQALLSIQQFNHYFFKRQYVETDNSGNLKKKPIHNAIYKLIKQMMDDNGKQQQIKEFASIFESKFNPYQQHDAQQFFLTLANMIQQEVKMELKIQKSFKDAQSAYFSYMDSNRSIIDRIFAGQVVSTVTCNKCSENSITYLPFVDICLQLSDVTLQGCLRNHFQSQKLQDLYECQKCKKKSKAVKKVTITKCPNFLMIVLKKFTLSGRKIQDKVKYSTQLDLKKFAEGHCGQTKFNLQSVIVHKGLKSNKGHYYCFTKRTKKDWFYCNDNGVKPIDAADILGKDAYIFIYERVK